MGKKNQSDLLASVALMVTAPSSQTWRHAEAGRFLQAFFYDTLALSNPSFADHLHHANSLKPFTVSPPLPLPRTVGGPATTRAAPVFVIRLTALTEEVHHALVEGLVRRCHTSSCLPLGTHSVDIQQVLFAHEDHSLAQITSYENLCGGLPARTIHMRFLTPTGFRTGQGNLPFPLPTSLYRGLWQKWQHFAPPSLRIDERLLTTVERHLFPARYALRTAVMTQQGAVQQIGCVGTCQFKLLGTVSAQDRRAITALSRFAAYAGVGMKTTMGMGQTQVTA